MTNGHTNGGSTSAAPLSLQVQTRISLTGKIIATRVYEIEKEVRRGIKRSGVPREEIFVGTKLWCNQFHPDDVVAALDESLADLDTPYVDLLMMHYPVVFKETMERLLRTTKVKALGVSNFNKGETETLIRESDTIPAVNQMEVHPYLQQKGFNQWLKSKVIHVVQSSPPGNMNPFYRATGWAKDIANTKRIIDNIAMQEIGRRYDKTPVQIALAWGINSGRSEIPKSVIDWQMAQNLEADFELGAEEDMDKISKLDKMARFNDPSNDYQYRLYSDLEGIEGTKTGRTH